MQAVEARHGSTLKKLGDATRADVDNVSYARVLATATDERVSRLQGPLDEGCKGAPALQAIDHIHV